jgi:polar amino acid transport system substrate-binding protein
MMNRKNFLLGLSVTIATLFTPLVGCTPQLSGGNSATPKQTLRMATDANYPPYGFYQTTGSGESIGFDIDLARAITTKLGYDLQVMPMDFNGVIPALQAKRADFAMAGITPTADRKRNVDFSQTYYLLD